VHGCAHSCSMTMTIFNAMRISTRFYENPSVLKLVKTAINTAITVKLLKSKLLK
jgi:hypothetical protein